MGMTDTEQTNHEQRSARRSAVTFRDKALDPIIAHEPTAYGWRGLTASGDVLDVQSATGMPEGEITVMGGDGEPIGHRAIKENAPGVAAYLDHSNWGIDLLRDNRVEAALAEFDAAVAIARTSRARFNRSLALLALGCWREGFADFEARHEFLPHLTEIGARCGIPRWRGEDIRGKRLLLVHDAGFGDTIMCLRYVPVLEAMGADVSLSMPPELDRLAAHVGSVECAGPADFYCGTLSLLHLLDQTPDAIPAAPYLRINQVIVDKWRRRIASPRSSRHWRIGIAWSVGHAVEGDYPRSIPLGQLVGALGRATELHSLQHQGADEAAKLGVISHDFADFADCAALASLMNQIVTIDTAAAHVAGAIGHRDTTVLLAHFASWRWRENPFYPWIKLARQPAPNDWAGALEAAGLAPQNR